MADTDPRSLAAASGLPARGNGDPLAAAGLLNAALAASDKASDVTPFVDFMLAALQAAMGEAVLTTGPGKVSGIMSGKVSREKLAAVGRQPGIAIHSWPS